MTAALSNKGSPRGLHCTAGAKSAVGAPGGDFCDTEPAVHWFHGSDFLDDSDRERLGFPTRMVRVIVSGTLLAVQCFAHVRHKLAHRLDTRVFGIASTDLPERRERNTRSLSQGLYFSVSQRRKLGADI